MSAIAFEPLLSKATIKAIDGVATKLSGAERATGKTVTRLLNHWNEMTPEEKEHVAEIVIATAATAATAIVSLRRAVKSPVKAAGRKIVKRLVKKRS
jgi:hypothetical protein